jgi:integrase
MTVTMPRLEARSILSAAAIGEAMYWPDAPIRSLKSSLPVFASRHVTARSGDPFAVQRFLGHADLKMATRYVQDVSKQTDRVIENSRKYVI